VVVKFQVDPDKAFQKEIEATLREVEDLTVPYGLMIQSWFKSNRAIFALKGPGKYPDLTQAYKTRKQREVGFVYPILKRSGALAASITNPSDSFAIAKVLNKRTLILGSSIPYGGYLHGGTKHMKARPWVLLGAEQTAPEEINQRREAWIEILRSWVEQKASRKK
jgi:hypothetical protein